jgi:hypothetical protein
MYGSDFDDALPPAAYFAGSGPLIWHDLVDPYVKNKQIWLCPCSNLSPTDSNGTPTSHFGYNAFYLTGLGLDFSNVNEQRPVSISSVAAPSETVFLATSKSSVAGSWCGDDGKYVLPPSQVSADCWGRPDAVAFETVPIAWLDTHVSRWRLGRFYDGQSPSDRWFDLEP